MALTDETRDALSAEGALARGIEGFLPRPAQLHLAQAIAGAIETRAN